MRSGALPTFVSQRVGNEARKPAGSAREKAPEGIERCRRQTYLAATCSPLRQSKCAQPAGVSAACASSIWRQVGDIRPGFVAEQNLARLDAGEIRWPRPCADFRRAAIRRSRYRATHLGELGAVLAGTRKQRRQEIIRRALEQTLFRQGPRRHEADDSRRTTAFAPRRLAVAGSSICSHTATWCPCRDQAREVVVGGMDGHAAHGDVGRRCLPRLVSAIPSAREAPSRRPRRTARRNRPCGRTGGSRHWPP